MNSTEALTYISFKLASEPGKIAKYGAALRKLGAYPDGRLTYPEIKPHHIAAAILTFAMAPAVNDDKLHERISELLNLSDSEGVTVIEALADLLETGGEQIWVQGLARVSVSLTRPCVVFAFKDPIVAEEVKKVDNKYISVREHDRVFGMSGALPFEKFAMVKASALKELAKELEWSTLNTANE